MKLLRNENIINILERTLNYVDARLTDHGRRVAYLVYRTLSPLRKFDRGQLRDISLLAMLHDVGAYKTEEIDKMVIFETIDVWEHSIYGYLFLKHFSPLGELAPVVLYHHANCREIKHLDNPEHQLLAQLVSLCDRADIFSLHGGTNANFRAYIDKDRDTKYRGDVVDLFLASGININDAYMHVDIDTDFHDVFRNTPLTLEDVIGYIKMIVYSIDFRSSQTVIHTVAMVCIAGYLAGLLNADANEAGAIKTGAMLHDIGKIGIPLSILESPDRLGDADMAIMKTHVEITAKILDGNVDDVILHMAANHHEKLDGSGYPNHLRAEDIDTFDRILIVADIFSALCGSRSYKEAYPKEKIIGILDDMYTKELIDPAITQLAISHIDDILKTVAEESGPVIKAYEEMNEEYERIRDRLRHDA